VELAKGFVEHPPGYFRVPVIKRGKEREQKSADDHIVKMRHNKIGVVELPIERRAGQHDAREARDQKLEQESDTEKHWRLELDFPAPHGSEPIKDLDTGGNSHDHRRDREKT